ncbi:transposase, partial [Nonomuraea cavernae]|uniref:transposase n=1 Tax=Nonomuraea cavernae TaxID=2045107 RepID=UPI0033E2C41E
TAPRPGTARQTIPTQGIISLREITPNWATESFRAGRKRGTVRHLDLPFLSVVIGSLVGVSRFRLQPSPAQEAALLEHCGHARFVWNLAVEQHSHWKSGRKSAPGFAEQCRQLTEARAENEWLRAGSIIVQQQALKDFAQAMANFFGKTHRRPTWRKRGQGEGFRVVAVKAGDVRRLSRNVGEVKVRRWAGCGSAGPVPSPKR